MQIILSLSLFSIISDTNLDRRLWNSFKDHLQHSVQKVINKISDRFQDLHLLSILLLEINAEVMTIKMEILGRKRKFCHYQSKIRPKVVFSLFFRFFYSFFVYSLHKHLFWTFCGSRLKVRSSSVQHLQDFLWRQSQDLILYSLLSLGLCLKNYPSSQEKQKWNQMINRFHGFSWSYFF